MPLSNGLRTRRQPNQACLNCKRKKHKCPGEKPACSSCIRLQQQCRYVSTSRIQSTDQPLEERLARVEKQLDLILSADSASPTSTRRNEANVSYNDLPTLEAGLGSASPTGDIQRESADVDFSTNDVQAALDLYFSHCHRQPIWCFDREDVKSPNCISEELISAIFALTSRYRGYATDAQGYMNTTRNSIMLRISNGTVTLETIEALCLLSFALFIESDLPLGQFHLALALQLSRSAMFDLESTYSPCDALGPRKRRVFWSLQVLDQFYGRQIGVLSTPTEVWRPSFSTDSAKPLRMDGAGAGLPEILDNGLPGPQVWKYAAQLGWIWSRVRQYVSDVSNSHLKDPWRHDSAYTMVLADLIELETRIPIRHRYDTVKFYQRSSEELKEDISYWHSWLKMQFLYYVIYTILNHPFLYIMASRSKSHLTIPNTFWRRSTDLVLRHATWIARFIDMVQDKKLQLSDPFFAHAAAIAASVHLYYCCTPDPKLKSKSYSDLSKCQAFLHGFTKFSPACAVLESKLDQLLRTATGGYDIDLREWSPSRLPLNVSALWDILEFNCKPSSESTSMIGLLHSSLTPSMVRSQSGNSTFEIIVAQSPHVTVDTSDGGQTAIAPIYDSNPNNEGLASCEVVVAPSESLQVNPSWLWQENAPQVHDSELSYQNSHDANMDNFEDSIWWDFGTL